MVGLSAWVSSRLRRGKWLCVLVTLFVGATTALAVLSWSTPVRPASVMRRALLRDAAELRGGSTVTLGGVRVGEIESLRFVLVDRSCDIFTEDSRAEERTDVCDPHAFCSPDHTCAVLEPYAGVGAHWPCVSTDDCRATEVCVGRDLATRLWDGPAGVCTSFVAPYPRVEASMRIDLTAVSFLADNASVATRNGALEIDLVPGPPSTPATELHERRPPAHRPRETTCVVQSDTTIHALRPFLGSAL